jgi:class 3 adenylate cyclase/ABC-type branched-subunit amino acid transport system substrate-binding protein
MASAGATRGFLFSDLRGYTAYVDANGPQAAAQLLDRYRALVRSAVAEHDGAEIRTEGDSFYVVFPSVSGALRCGLAIVERAAAEPDQAGGPIRVGVGIHAGETVETAEGYVGQAVNVAARLCALAGPGEVLVTGTVRSLTQGMVPATFENRGRRRLKGIAEPVEVDSVRPVEAGSIPRWRKVRKRWLVAGAAVVAVAVVAAVWLASRPAPLSGTWKVGLSLPLSGWPVDGEFPLQRAAELAVAEARRAGKLDGYDVELVARDEGDAMSNPTELARQNAEAFVADPSVVAMIGAGNSLAGEVQIPLTNAAGLLQCSSTNTNPALTKPSLGAGALRSANPTRINYVRLPALSDVEAAAVASFARNELDASFALIVSDARPDLGFVGEEFRREFEALGGTTDRRALNPGADGSEALEPLTEVGVDGAIVFFGGLTDGGAPQLRKAMVSAGWADVPFVSWDGLWDGSGEVANSFVALAGSAAAGSYISHPTVGTIKNEFDTAYRTAYGDLVHDTLYEYAAATYACVEIVLQSLNSVRDVGNDPATLREAERAHVADQQTLFDTVVGSVGFDANGDSLRQVVSFYRVDTAAAGGKGDWVLVRQQDFGPAR